MDGRALNESVFQDYMKIALNYRDAQPLLDKYGVQVLVLQGFEYWRGTVYMLGAALADPTQTKWKLVYQDKTAMVFMRQPPPGVQPLNPEEVFTSLDAQCTDHLAARAGQAGLRRRPGRSLHASWAGAIGPAQWLAAYDQIRNGTFHASATDKLLKSPRRRLPAAAPAWIRPLLLALTAILFLTWFTGEISDSDIWLHLMTGRHTLETRALTVPDPFSYTSNLNNALPGRGQDALLQPDARVAGADDHVR